MILACSLPLKTRNPNNGSQGFSRTATFAKARRRKHERKTAHETLLLAHGAGVADAVFELTANRKLVVELTRVAPSNGLDPHDALGPSLKGVIDGIGDALGLTNDRDARVQWKLEQRRGKPKEYAVEVEIRKVER